MHSVFFRATPPLARPNLGVVSALRSRAAAKLATAIAKPLTCRDVVSKSVAVLRPVQVQEV